MRYPDAGSSDFFVSGQADGAEALRGRPATWTSGSAGGRAVAFSLRARTSARSRRDAEDAAPTPILGGDPAATGRGHNGGGGARASGRRAARAALKARCGWSSGSRERGEGAVLLPASGAGYRVQSAPRAACVRDRQPGGARATSDVRAAAGVALRDAKSRSSCSGCRNGVRAAGWAACPMFLFFSNRLGCFGSLLVSAVVTLILLVLSRRNRRRSGSVRRSGVLVPPSTSTMSVSDASRRSSFSGAYSPESHQARAAAMSVELDHDEPDTRPVALQALLLAAADEEPPAVLRHASVLRRRYSVSASGRAPR